MTVEEIAQWSSGLPTRENSFTTGAVFDLSGGRATLLAAITNPPPCHPAGRRDGVQDSCLKGWRAISASLIVTPSPGPCGSSIVRDGGLPTRRPHRHNRDGARHFLLNDEVGRGDAEMQRGDACHGAERVVRRDPDARAFGQRRAIFFVSSRPPVWQMSGCAMSKACAWIAGTKFTPRNQRSPAAMATEDVAVRWTSPS